MGFSVEEQWKDRGKWIPLRQGYGGQEVEREQISAGVQEVHGVQGESLVRVFTPWLDLPCVTLLARPKRYSKAGGAAFRWLRCG